MSVEFSKWEGKLEGKDLDTNFCLDSRPDMLWLGADASEKPVVRTIAEKL